MPAPKELVERAVALRPALIEAQAEAEQRTYYSEAHMELCRRQAEEGTPFSYQDDMLLGCVGREIMIQCWETVQGDLVRTVGASAIRAGQRMERIYRDLSIGNAHRNTSLRDWAFRELACAHLGIETEMRRSVLQRRPSLRSSTS